MKLVFVCVLLFFAKTYVSLEIDLSTTNGYEWKAALPNKSQSNPLF